MSMYFDIGDETLWNPSNGVGRLFLRQVEVFEVELELPSGIGQDKYRGDPDTLEVDPVVYEEFTRKLVTWHCRTGHSVMLALSEGFVATAVALARRAGIEVEMSGPGAGHVPGGVQRDVQVPGDPRVTSAAVVTALDARAQEMDHWTAH
ncbi:DUF6086 family protein [Streptomyces triticisoli]|uniref:DUF6086 family protein n=1 Tax=Streptomyces triticisoli TaxID=2182797 RepID=UPI001300B2E6|nr:DUF6086 family protein [Streptomyces triticisoli]